MRIKDEGLPGKHRLRIGLPPATSSIPPQTPVATDATSVTLSEAVALYLRVKGNNRPKTFHAAAQRSCVYVIDVCGDKNLLSYSKLDATRFRDALLERALTGSSITRIFGTVRSVTNFAASEIGVMLVNPFTGVYFDRQAGVSERAPMPASVIAHIQSECVRIDNDLRWLVALVSGTGMRLAEAAGLHCDDIILDAGIPTLSLEPLT